MTAASLIIGTLTGALYFVTTLWLRRRREVRHLRGLCRRCADHLDNEHRCTLQDPERNAELIGELARAGWDGKRRER
jgi:hypothetical protein